MSQIIFQPASQEQLRNWDGYISRSVNGTLFHTRAFLSYHGDRFANTARWMVAKKNNDVVALLSYSAEQSARGSRIAVSPFGASYGGFVLKNYPTYNTSRALVSALIAHLREAKLVGFRMTPPISCCASKSLDILTFCLLEQGFQSICRDISSVVSLSRTHSVWKTVTSRARRHARKALANDIRVAFGAPEQDFWVPMYETFLRHSTTPTHDREQLHLLMNLVPGHVRLDVAYWREVPAAAVASFVLNKRVVCGFYLAHTEESKPTQALTLALLKCMERCREEGYVFFDLGTSSVNMKARENVLLFKEGFSAESHFRETFEWGVCS